MPKVCCKNPYTAQFYVSRWEKHVKIFYKYSDEVTKSATVDLHCTLVNNIDLCYYWQHLKGHICSIFNWRTWVICTATALKHCIVNVHCILRLFFTSEDYKDMLKEKKISLKGEL